MLISLLILSSWLFIGVFPLRLTAKEVRFIETRYPHAAGYKMKTMKVVVFLISLLTTPALFVVALFDLDDPNRIYNLVICFFILLCALTEALFLNRGNGKHRVLPLALAAMNFASFLTLFGMVFMLSRTGIVVSILSAYSNLIVEFALLLASVNIALFMKQLLIKLSFSSVRTSSCTTFCLSVSMRFTSAYI